MYLYESTPLVLTKLRIVWLSSDCLHRFNLDEPSINPVRFLVYAHHEFILVFCGSSETLGHVNLELNPQPVTSEPALFACSFFESFPGLSIFPTNSAQGISKSAIGAVPFSAKPEGPADAEVAA
ncbi:hypothetical protein Tco_0530952 [Tanacetum coccineum]